MGELNGKSIIVTGAGGGIGRETCVVLAESGARLIVSDVSTKAGEETVDLVKSKGGEAAFFHCDLAIESAIADLVDFSVKTYGRLDGAFNNAGLEQRNKPIIEISTEEWNHAIQIDLTSVFFCVKYQIKAMLETGGGSIVNTASALGQVAIPNAGEYVTAKHGVIGLTRAAATDYGPSGIRVNAILPGIIRTQMIARLTQEPTLSAYFEQLKNRHTLKRFGSPSEIGEACKWLLSDASSFVNGSAMAVDGGYLIG